MRVLVTGATGFTGSYVVPLLLERGIEVRCLARASSDRSVLPQAEIEWFTGDVQDPASVEQALEGRDALVNIVYIRKWGPMIVQGALAAGVKRAIFVSTTSLFTQLAAASKAQRIAAEKAIETSGLDYTILRPTMIYGSSRDRNMCRLVQLMARTPIIPIFGNGAFLQQPIYVSDVAESIIRCLLDDQTIGKAYNISGAAALTYNQVIDTIARLSGRKVLKVHFPAAPMIALVKLFERFSIPFPLKAEQIMRLNEHKNFDYDSAAQDFGYTPLSFEEGMRLELQEMKARG